MPKQKPLTQSQEARLVAWVNKQRAWMVSVQAEPAITRLREGRRESPLQNPIARSIGNGRAEVFGDSWRATPWAELRSCPDYVQKFCERFDSGGYPGLDLDAPNALDRARALHGTEKPRVLCPRCHGEGRIEQEPVSEVAG